MKIRTIELFQVGLPYFGGVYLADRRPGEYFTVDANGGMLPETALRMLPDGLDFVLEAPCSTWRETASLCKRCPVPIIMDELAELDGDIARIIAKDIADGIGLKVSKAGGLTRGQRDRNICLAAGPTISVQDTVGSAIAFSIAKAVTGGRVSPEVEREGLDLGEHGERAYNY